MRVAPSAMEAISAYRCEIDLSPGRVMTPETEDAGVMTFLMRILYSKAPRETNSALRRGARSLACRVEIRLDLSSARGNSEKKCRHECRHSTQECVGHVCRAAEMYSGGARMVPKTTATPSQAAFFAQSRGAETGSGAGLRSGGIHIADRTRPPDRSWHPPAGRTRPRRPEEFDEPRSSA